MKNNWFQEYWQYREVFYFLVWRDIKVRYKQTLLGAAWAIIQPFCTMVVFTIFFGRMAKMPSEGIPYPIFTYSALVAWTYFAGTLNLVGNSLVLNQNLLTKVYFPRIALPVSAALSGLVDFSLASSILVAMMGYYRIGLSWEMLFWPFLIIPLLLLALGVGMILASLNVKYRDIKHTIPFIIQLWLFLTPIIYPTSIIPEKFQVLMMLNPTSGIIEAFRASLLPTRQLDWQMLGISVVLTILIFSIGFLYFRKTEREFADIV